MIQRLLTLTCPLLLFASCNTTQKVAESSGQRSVAEVTTGDLSEPMEAEFTVDAPKAMDDMSPRERESLFQNLKLRGEINDKPAEVKVASINPSWPTSNELVGVVSCDANDEGLFELIVYLDGAPFAIYPASPGHQSYNEKDGFWRHTNLNSDPNDIHGSGGNRVRGTTELHRVSGNKSYADALMPHTVWIGTQNGFAVHAATGNGINKLGHPASNGCIRLHPDHAKQFYDMVNAVGAANSSVYFAGYDCYRGSGSAAKAIPMANVPVPRPRPSNLGQRQGQRQAQAQRQGQRIPVRQRKGLGDLFRRIVPGQGSRRRPTRRVLFD